VIDWQKIMRQSRTNVTRRSMSWRNNMTEKKNFLNRKTRTFNRSQSKLNQNKLRWSLPMRQIEPNGIKKRAFCYLQRRTQWQSKNLFRERMTTCWRRSRDLKSRTRETNGSTRNQCKWARWRLTINSCMEWEVAFLIGSIWEEPGKGFKSQREEM